MKVAANTDAELIKKLIDEQIETWFDLGLFLDRIKQHRAPAPLKYKKSFSEFKRKLQQGSLGFLTFQYAVDGVSIEIGKYSKVFKSIFPHTSQIYITGDFKSDSHKVVPPYVKKEELAAAKAFSEWDLYNTFFFTSLNRGSEKYNLLIHDLWRETLDLVKQLSQLVIRENISLLYVVNVNSNPGNVALALATVIVSEYLHLPVINNSHDFYWEGGTPSFKKRTPHSEKGPRDFFFRNAHIGELFSIIEMVYPWDSPLWIQVTINHTQANHLIEELGHNPARVTEIGTAVDMSDFKATSKRKKINTFYQFERILSRYEDVLISYATEDVLNNTLVDVNNPRPILLSARKTKPIHHFLNENIVFLQPTRIISRKQIEVGFEFIGKFVNQEILQYQFRNNDNLKITLLITGPIASGHYDYFKELLDKFNSLLDELPVHIRDKVYLAFLFSELDKEDYQKRFTHPVGISDLYNISSLILLPSKTEGRGLPIIEAAAAGVPIFCNRYAPLDVFNEVIGKHLPEKLRLRIFEYDGRHINKQDVAAISKRIFFPHLFIDEQQHNREVIQFRYSLGSLQKDLEEIIRRLYYQALPGKKLKKMAKQIWRQYPSVFLPEKDLQGIMDITHRKYLGGICKTRYMSMLKSLIDPSAFREELQKQNSYLYGFAKKLCDSCSRNLTCEKKIAFYKAVEALLLFHKGSLTVLHDHSFPYRFRNRRYYPYQDYTLQELTGAIHYLFNQGFDCRIETNTEVNAHFFTDWQLAMIQLTGSYALEIDDRDFFVKKLQANVPIAFFPGQFLQNELELIALQSIRSRLELPIDEQMTYDDLRNAAQYIAPIYVFVSKYETESSYNYNALVDMLEQTKEFELKLIYEEGLLQIVPIEQYTVGIHFRQLGNEALRLLQEIKEKEGVLITTRSEAVIMTDIVGVDKLHVGKAHTDELANFLGIRKHAGFVQFVPRDTRPTVFYPTPKQTGKDLYDFLHKNHFDFLYHSGPKRGFEKYVMDKQKNGFVSFDDLFKQYHAEQDAKNPIEHHAVSGIYSDGNSWSGVLLQIPSHVLIEHFNFQVVFDPLHPRSVVQFAKDYTEKHHREVVAGWNGGYILNAELVGKLGLSEDYIGSPLGLLIQEGVVQSPPLFHKPAFVIDANGGVSIGRVDCSKGISVSRGTSRIIFDPENYNVLKEDQLRGYFDLQYTQPTLYCPDKHIVRLAGNKVLEIIANPQSEIALLPTGLTLVLTTTDVEELNLEVGCTLSIHLPGMDNVLHAVEAGPLLLKNQQIAIDMELEGWRTENSIKTQAARLDYTNMRGPKIAAGVNANNDILVLAINGRIRESVGATHHDMANILLEYGAVDALGFDPGGSSTLIFEGNQLNISPYNADYLRKPYAAPPQPRFVSSAIFVTKMR